MTAFHPRHRTWWTSLLAVLLAGSGSAALGQGEPSSGVATLEAQYEEAFASAVELPPDTEPMWVLQAWGPVFLAANMLDRARRAEAGQDPSTSDGQAVTEEVLRRWQRLRPKAGGPELFRTFQISDPAAKRAAVLEVLDRYPDDVVVVWQSTVELRQAGELGRAVEVAEAFLARNPDHPMGYRLLADTASRNKTLQQEVLQRWAGAAPGDPALVVRWMASGLPKENPAETDRLLGELFVRQPTGQDGLNACRQALAVPTFAAAARACIARIAGAPDVPPQVAQQATSALAKMAAADGDRSALLEALDALEPSARIRALIAAADALEAPQRCDERVELLTAAEEALGAGDGDYPSVASALLGCSERPAVQDLYLALLERAPSDQASDIIHRWAVRVNGVYRGQLPAGTAGVLEERLRTEPEAAKLFQALDVVYQLSDPNDRRFELLRRWRDQVPASFGREQAADLAGGFVERGDPAAAVEILEQQLGTQFEPALAEMLWALYLRAASPERAEQLAAELMASSQPSRARTGHALAARSAALRGDLAVAERQYWKALEGDFPRREVAIELLSTLAWQSGGSDAAALERMARRICEETRLSGDRTQVPECAADLLTGAGLGAAAAASFAEQSADLPDDPMQLRQLASTAQSAGQVEVAERVLRRLLELDPKDENHWINLGVFLEKQGRDEDVEDLLQRSRELFSPPPTFLYRATGRALTAAGRPRQAIDVLLEARGILPNTRGGDWSRGWIDHELGEAYKKLGEQSGIVLPRPGPAPVRAFRASEPAAIPEGTGQELRVYADALQSGEDGRYDPDGAADLYARAAALGDPSATIRLALLRHLGLASAPVGGPSARELYDRSWAAVSGLAAEGDGYAQYLVGTAALVGLGGREDLAAARRWLEAAAARNESWAWHNLAWMAETGRGLETLDPAAALESYRRASRLGNTESMRAVARLTLTLYGSEASCREGLQWLEKAARAGNAAAAAFLGKLLFYGRGECVTRDPQAALAWLEVAAATHQPGGVYDLAMALLLNGGDEASRTRGATLLEEAASRPDALAVETLAFLTATGIGVPRDPARARQLIAEAARLGSDAFPRLRQQLGLSEVYRWLFDQGTQRLQALADPAATGLLVRLSTVDLGGESEPERTAELALGAAEAGDAMAMRVLSDAYKRGAGVERDPAAARRWTRRCAEAGNAFCMMFLGNELIRGEEVEQDLEAGLRWLRRAAEAGNWWAIAALGRLYDEGRYGLLRDPDTAAAWKQRLAELGDAESVGWLLYHGYRQDGG